MVHLKSSMETFFKKIFFEKRNCQVLHISIDLKIKQSQTLTHIKSPDLMSSKARQSIRQLKLVNRELQLKTVFSLIDLHERIIDFGFVFVFIQEALFVKNIFKILQTHHIPGFFLSHVDPLDQSLNLFLLSLLLLSRKRVQLA